MSIRKNALAVIGLSLALAGLIGGAALAQEKANKGAKVGDKAPAWTLKDTKGKEYKSSDYQGKIVVLEWVNPLCPVCRGAHEDGRIPNMIKELRAMEDVVFLAVNSTHNTTAEQNDKALERYGVEYPVLLDTEGVVGHAFGARTTPHIFVIDAQGVLRYNGALDNNRANDKSPEEITNYVLNAVKQIKAGETVSPDTTQPYGCSVKYAKKGGEGKGREHPGRGKDHPDHPGAGGRGGR